MLVMKNYMSKIRKVTAPQTANVEHQPAECQNNAQYKKNDDYQPGEYELKVIQKRTAVTGHSTNNAPAVDKSITNMALPLVPFGCCSLNERCRGPKRPLTN
jgi:hypothetical protein